MNKNGGRSVYVELLDVFMQIIITSYSKQVRMKAKGQQQTKLLYDFTFRHLQGLPVKDMDEIVLLLSYTNEALNAFKILDDSSQNESEYYRPQMTRLNEQINVVSPTDALLQPDQGERLVSMHYIFNTAKKVKFWIVIGQADITANAMSNIKKTLQTLVKMFAQSDKLGKELSKCCGVIITNPNPNRSVDANMRLLNRLYKEEKFLDNKQAKELIKLVLDSKKIIFFNGKPTNKEQFITMNEQLAYFDLKQKVTLNNPSQYVEYAKRDQKLCSIWKSLFEQLYTQLEELINNRDSSIQKDIISNQYLFQLRFASPIHKVIDPDIHKSKALRQLKFINRFLDIIQIVTHQKGQFEDQQMQTSKKICHLFFEALEELQYINDGRISFFFKAYFDFYRCLAKTPANQSMIQKIHFEAQISRLDNSKARSFIITCLSYLQQELLDEVKANEHQLPHDKIIEELTTLLEKLSLFKDQCFYTQRIVKKILKYRAQFAYIKANLVRNSPQRKQLQQVQHWLKFLSFAEETSLIDSSKLQKTCLILADELFESRKFKVALKLYQKLPEYQVHKKMLLIYEKQMRFHPQLLQCALLDDWSHAYPYFQQYCQFLLRLGFNQKVRQLCLQGLRVMRQLNSSENMQKFKRWYINARHENSKRMHHDYLETTMLKDSKKIVIDLAMRLQIQNVLQEE